MRAPTKPLYHMKKLVDNHCKTAYTRGPQFVVASQTGVTQHQRCPNLGRFRTSIAGGQSVPSPVGDASARAWWNTEFSANSYQGQLIPKTSAQAAAITLSVYERTLFNLQRPLVFDGPCD